MIECRNEEHEAERVVSEILHHRFQKKTSHGDYAILYRGNHQARLFEKALRIHKIPYFLSGGTSFFSRTEIKDVMAYLRLLANPDDDAAFLRVINTPRREIGPATLEKLWRLRPAGARSACSAPADELGLGEQLGERALTRLRGFAEWISSFARRAGVGATQADRPSPGARHRLRQLVARECQQRRHR